MIEADGEACTEADFGESKEPVITEVEGSLHKPPDKILEEPTKSPARATEDC